MQKEINCEKVKENIDKLKTLKSEFLAEMKRIKKDGIAGNIYELKKKIEEVKGFLDEELKGYLLTKEEREKEEKLNKELEEYLHETQAANEIHPREAPQELKDRIVRWKGNIVDFSNNILYPNLQTVKGDLYAYGATIFSAKSLQTVRRIILTKSNFQKFFDEDGKFNWDQAEKEGKLILPRETRERVDWI